MIRALMILIAVVVSASAAELLPGKKRILFLGDSITYAGGYVDAVELYFAVREPLREVLVINCGLPSETLSGLSEAGHAGGQFPRPDLHERLDRVFALVKPDVVFACYGMNCGIYLPFSQTRFDAYVAGVVKLREKVTSAGVEIIFLTPPVFDPLPIQSQVKSENVVKDGGLFEGYDGVLARYSQWLVQQGREKGWRVVDTHTAMLDALAVARKRDAGFSFAKDGVHCNEQGQWVLAGAIFKNFGISFDPDSTAYLDLKKLIHQRGRILVDAYLSAAGHKRPRMNPGLSLDKAREKAAAITLEIRKLAK